MAARGQNKYNPGDIVGPNGYKLVERTYHPEKKRPRTKGIFECPEGHRFEADIYHVANGKSTCRQCNPNPWFQYKDGTEIGSNGIFLIRRTTRNEDGSWNALMRCHCGNEFEHEIYSIANDIVKSCGCLLYIKKYKPGDLLGPNKIELIRYTGEKDCSGKPLGEFQCPYCENTYVTRIDRVVTGDGHYDCGCQEAARRKAVGRKNIKDDLAGKVFGKLTVLRRTEQKAYRSDSSPTCYLWECQCECGNTCLVPRSALVSGNSRP